MHPERHCSELYAYFALEVRHGNIISWSAVYLDEMTVISFTTLARTVISSQNHLVLLFSGDSSTNETLVLNLNFSAYVNHIS